MSRISSQDAERLDRYVDGFMPDAERAAFDRALLQTPALRAEFERQARIDESLRRLFAPPKAAPATADAGDIPVRAGNSVIRRIGWIAGIAAMIAIGAAVAWPTMFPSKPKLGPTAGGMIRLHEPAASYRDIVEQGFRPYTVCKDDAQFAEYTRSQFDQPLIVKDPAGLEVVGWVYEQRVLSPSTLSLLVRHGKEQIVVFLDRKAKDRELALAPTSDLHIFRREVGNIVMYEVSPEKEAVVLPRMAEPEPKP